MDRQAFDGYEAPIHRGLNESYMPLGIPYFALLVWTLVWGLAWFLWPYTLPWDPGWRWRTVLLGVPWAGGLAVFAVATRTEAQWVEIFFGRLFESDDLSG